MDTGQAKKLKELEKQNGRLKKLVADLSLENGCIESFSGRVGDELLDREISYSLKEAQMLIKMCCNNYNRISQYSSLGYRYPVPAAVVVQPS